ncbi:MULTISPECIES: hypothetical protein [unclassified Streptomyces]|uniref:hypothetical protein n=1 Tax=unclassified Streptomyces TaxID=2593676 RepID=UPI002888566E|nr:hypothetical protein [Streptomyces sp. DSM 41633]
MNKNLFRASAVAAAAVAFSGIISVSQSASAAQTCSAAGANARIDAMPGIIPEAQLSAPTCVEALPDNKVRGKATVNWGFINDGQSDMTSKRYTSFKVTARLESRAPGGTDVVVTSKTCDLTANINAAPNGAFACLTPSATLDPSKQWSGDATVVYDIEGDNKGPITWQLVGSPLMS